MKKIMLSIFVFLTIFGFSQNNTISVASRFGFQNIPVSNIKTNYAFKSGAGINYAHVFENNLRLTTGAYYSEKGFKLKYLLSDNFEKPLFDEVIEYNYNYVSIPLMMGYTFKFEKINLYSNIGFSGNYLLNSSTRMNSTNYSLDTKSSNRFDIAATVNFGAEFPIGEKLLLNTELNLRKGFVPISGTENGLLKERTHIGGFLQVGLGYRF